MARGEHSPEERLHRQNCRFYVACPRCGAAAGDKCVGVQGQKRAANHTERWQLFDPAHVAAKAPRKEKAVSYFDDNEDRLTGLPRFRPQRLRLAKEDLTCKNCGAECYWQEVVAGDGHIKPRLFEGGKPHVCKPSADDFEALA